MKAPIGSIPDSTVIKFIYTKEGKEVEFDAEHFPADFNDTTYTFVKRYDKLIREGNAKPPIKDFVILSPTGNDTTQAILSDPREQYVLFIKNMDANLTWGKDFREVVNMAAKKEIPLSIITSDYDKVVNFLHDENLVVTVYKGDVVAIKTAARSTPTLYLLQQGVILNKWGRLDLKKAVSN
jgi:hypothetical protein